MEFRQIPPVGENRVMVSREEPPPRPAVSPQERPSEGTPQRPEQVGAVPGTPDIHEFAEQLAEILNEAMRNLQFSINFEPDREEGIVTIKVIDGEGRLIRTIPLSKLLSISRRLVAGAVENGILLDRAIF
jgi:uncharacterized FlaG/YvyC family protein